RTIVHAAVILAPSGFVRVAGKIRPGDVVVRPDFHPAKAREVAFRLIGADAFIHKRNRVVHPARIPTGVEGIPTAAFVGADRGESANVIADVGDGITFVGDNERERTALALAHDDNALALAGTVRL